MNPKDSELQKRLYHYELPQELIAQEPISDRASSRLMVLGREGGIGHAVFSDIGRYLRAGDCLVINDTKVIPARLVGERPTGGSVEVLLLTRVDGERWEALVKPGRKAKVGDVLDFGGLLRAAIERDDLPGGKRLVRFEYEGIFEEVLASLGEMPLPPYITRKLEDVGRYQTVYASHEGSVAAPTAGLHFTKELLEELEGAGISIARITLHVGLGTFRPVKSENLAEHEMHAEQCIVSQEAARTVNACKAAGGRVVAVGTTSCRTLESMCDSAGRLEAGSMWTSKYIYPGYEFRIMDGLITNFHLPESTLIMLVSAFAGRERTMAAYAEAVAQRYRFFSFGDAMLIV